ARQWCCGGIAVVNLYALRSPYPEALKDSGGPWGPNNTRTIKRWLVDDRTAIVVAAWGAGWKRLGLARDNVESYAKDAGKELYCLGTTKDGSPRHPLYVPKTQMMEWWRGQARN